MALILPLLMVILGAGAGIGAGLILRPAPAPPVASLPTEAGLEQGLPPCGPAEAATASAEGEEKARSTAPHDFVKFNNQFVVPVVTGARVSALVILSLSLEVLEPDADAIRQLEPKFRDSFLKVLFDHANQGGFEGAFTGSNNMTLLHGGLLEAARGIAGPRVIDVLISDYMRQDR